MKGNENEEIGVRAGNDENDKNEVENVDDRESKNVGEKNVGHESVVYMIKENEENDGKDEKDENEVENGVDIEEENVEEMT